MYKFRPQVYVLICLSWYLVFWLLVSRSTLNEFGVPSIVFVGNMIEINCTHTQEQKCSFARSTFHTIYIFPLLHRPQLQNL